MVETTSSPPMLVVGLGNPLLGDDGVGWVIVDELERRLAVRGGSPGVEIDRLSLGGLRLMERLLGYARVVIVDAFSGGGDPPGHVRLQPLSAVPDASAGHLGSAHDASLSTALAAARALGATVPEEVLVLTVGARSVMTFTEELTPEVAEAVGPAVERLLGLCDAGSAVATRA